MTREENLHWINEEIRTWENECQSKHPIKEALYAAREVLQQEPIYTSEVAQKAYEDGKKDGYIQRKIETIAENDLTVEYVDIKEVKRIAKEMYLEVANMELDVKTISDCISYTSSKCREVLENKLQVLPSVKKEPRKGHWEVVSDGYGDNAYICCCSECKDTVWVYKDADRRWNYCPNCGADMREGQA